MEAKKNADIRHNACGKYVNIWIEQGTSEIAMFCLSLYELCKTCSFLSNEDFDRSKLLL